MGNSSRHASKKRSNSIRSSAGSSGKKSALDQLEEIKRVTNEKKSAPLVSLTTFPFPEMATAALASNDQVIPPTDRDRSGTMPVSTSNKGIEEKKKKGIKKGKKFASSEDFSLIIANVNEKEEERLKKKQLKQEENLQKEMQRQTSKLQRNSKKMAKIQKGKEIIHSHTKNTKKPSGKSKASPDKKPYVKGGNK